MQVNGELIIKCERCDTDNPINSEDAEFEVQETEQRDFGLEKNWVFDFDFDCENYENCKNNISGTYEKWESPVGQNGIENITVNGGKVQNNFSFEFTIDE